MAPPAFATSADADVDRVERLYDRQNPTVEMMIRLLPSQWHVRAAVVAMCCGLAPACSSLAHPAQPAARSDPSPADTAVFSAVVRSVRSSLDRPLYVDPRPIHDRAASWEPAGETTAGLARIVGSRQIVLQRLKVPMADAGADLNCAIGNMRVAYPEEDRRKVPCDQRQPSLAIAVSMPSTDLPPGFDRGAHPNAEFRRLRVLQISVAPRYGSHSMYDYVVLENRDHTWMVVWKVLVATAD